MASLTQESLSGIRWSALSQLAGQVAQYGSFILLARLLAPADFGTVASATLVIGLVAMLNELGLGSAIIQRPTLQATELNACFWSNMAVGLLLWALMAGTAGWIAAFFGNPAVAPILVALAASFPLVGLSVVPKALMEKALRFKPLALVDGLSSVSNGLVAIGFALAGAGAWSLVAGTLAGYVIQVIGLYAVAGYRPGGRFALAEARDLFGFGLSVLGSRLTSYFNQNIDYLVIGRLLGPTALGAYSLAYKLVTWPVIKISHVTLRVAFPAFSRLQDDDEALRRSYTRLIATLALVVFPMLAGLAVVGPEAIPWIFGAQWRGAVVPTQILCLAGMIKALNCSVGSIFMSRGRPDLEFKTNLLGTLILGGLILTGVRWGVSGVSAAVLVAAVVGYPIQQGVANGLIRLTWAEYLRPLRVPVLATLTLVLALAGWRMLSLAQAWPLWALLTGAGAVAALAYGLALLGLGYDVLRLLRTLTGRRAPAQAVTPTPLAS